MPKLALEDLNHVLEHACEAFRSLAGAQLFITGGTGFVGKWLPNEVILLYDEEQGLDLS